MATNIKNRVPAYPGRVKLLPVAGQADTYTMTRADAPTEPGTAVNKALLDAIGVHTLDYAKSGTVHALTGLNGASGVLSCQFKATSGFAAGDTFTVDGAAYTIQLSNGKAAKKDLFVSGSIVSCILDTVGKTVNFKAGGGYAEGDVIAAGKLAEVYENAVKYSTLELIGEGALQWGEQSFINPAGTIVYTYTSDDKVTVATIDGTLIATIDVGLAMLTCALGFDSSGNCYLQVHPTNSSYDKVLRVNTDGTYQALSDLWATNVSMFWAYNSFYVHPEDQTTIYRYSTEGTQISSFYIGFKVKILGGLCGESQDSATAGPLYAFTQDTDYNDNLYKLTAAGSVTWKSSGPSTVSENEYHMGYTPGYIYYVSRDRSGSTLLYRMQLTDNSAAKDSSYSVRYTTHGKVGFFHAVTLCGAAYIMDYGGKRFTLFKASTGELAYNSEIYFAGGNGAAYWNNEGKYYALHPPITGYKVLSDD